VLIIPCTIKSRSSLLAPVHPGGPWNETVVVVVVCVHSVIDLTGNLLLLFCLICLTVTSHSCDVFLFNWWFSPCCSGSSHFTSAFIDGCEQTAGISYLQKFCFWINEGRKLGATGQPLCIWEMACMFCDVKGYRDSAGNTVENSSVFSLMLMR